MTTVELRTSIMTDLDQMSVEMLESVSRYIRRLRHHARPSSKVNDKEAAPDGVLSLLGAGAPEANSGTEEFTPRVMRFKRGNPWYATDEEVDRLRQEHLNEKYK